MLSTWEKSKFRSNQYLNSIWNNCYKITKEHFYFVGAKEFNRNSITEALLTNYITVKNINKTAKYHTYHKQLTLDFNSTKITE